jgi:hypothetical protein
VTFFAPDTSLVSQSQTPLRTTFRMRVNGKTVPISTVGEAYKFLTTLSAVEWMEYRALHDEAVDLLERAASDATNAVRALFVSAKLL